MFKSYTFTGQTPGKHILILGAVHGNETAGTLAQQRIIRQIEQGQLRIISGSVTFVPIVNEAAYNKNCRYIDTNLNRVIKFHQTPQNNEERIANELIKLIDNCDIMLDLHSTHCPQDKEFAFIDYPTENNRRLSALIPVQTTLSGWPQIYINHPEITNFCTEEYAHQKGKMGITVECGYHKSPHAAEVASQSILNLLSYFGCIKKEPIKLRQPQTIALNSFITKQQEGRLSRNYQHLDKISTGETIAVYSDGKTVKAPFDGYIIMPNPEAAIGAEWFYFGKE